MLLDFFKIVTNLKNVPRQGWINKLGHKNPETVAEHIFVMAVMGMIVSDLKNKDTGKILRMILLHDLAESITGDITPDQLPKESKISLENDTMENILKCLPNQLSEYYQSLWNEFQENSSTESKLIHQLDKLEMALQAKIYSKNFSLKNLTPFFNSAKEAITDKDIKTILDEIIKRD